MKVEGHTPRTGKLQGRESKRQRVCEGPTDRSVPKRAVARQRGWLKVKGGREETKSTREHRQGRTSTQEAWKPFVRPKLGQSKATSKTYRDCEGQYVAVVLFQFSLFQSPVSELKKLASVGHRVKQL